MFLAIARRGGGCGLNVSFINSCIFCVKIVASQPNIRNNFFGPKSPRPLEVGVLGLRAVGGLQWANSGRPAQIEELMELASYTSQLFQKKFIKYVKMAGFLALAFGTNLEQKFK